MAISSHPFSVKRASIALATIFSLISFIDPVSAYPKGKTIKVTKESGITIQSAIDSAKGGDKIVVESGSYAEQLTISKNGISLVGHDVTLTPPETPITNTCSGLAGNDTLGNPTQAGICITGSNMTFFPVEPVGPGQLFEHVKVQSVGTYVKDAYVSGFTVANFTGINIAVLGARDATVKDNILIDGPQYGALTVGSKGTSIRQNKVKVDNDAFHFIGICMDDKSDVTITYNEIGSYFIGLCVQTNNAILHNNIVHDCCIGAFVDPGISNAKLHDNTIYNNAAACGFGWGIGVVGASGTSLKGNNITGIKGGEPGSSAGIFLMNDDASGKVTEGTRVEGNVLSGNDLDVEVTTTGTGNVFKDNECTTSFPEGICPNK